VNKETQSDGKTIADGQEDEESDGRRGQKDSTTAVQKCGERMWLRGYFLGSW
jgi:hypothetical protein